jgi:hypothetical protein
MKLLVLICIIHQVVGIPSFLKLGKLPGAGRARLPNHWQPPSISSPWSKKATEAKFDSIAKNSWDAKQISDFFKALPTGGAIPEVHQIALKSFKRFLDQGIGSSRDPVKTFRSFMDNIDSMLDPKMHGIIRRNEKFRILGMARNAKRIDSKMIQEIERHLKILNYEYYPSRFNLDDWIRHGVIRMDTKEMNQRIFDLAKRRGDEELLKYFQTLDESKFLP